MQQDHYGRINRELGNTHGSNGGRTLGAFEAALRAEDIKDKRPQIRDKHTGSGMNAHGIREHIERKAQHQAQQLKGRARQVKGQQQDEEHVKIGVHHLVHENPVQHQYLEQDQQDESDNIS